MTIHDKPAFEDAQIMARAAIEMTERWWKEAYWYGAMQALKEAYWYGAMQALKAAYKEKK